jgi:hypothetical protein
MAIIRTILLVALAAAGQAQRGPAREPAATFVLKPARVFDGDAMQEGWAVRVRGDRIDAAGPAASIDAAGAKRSEERV